MSIRITSAGRRYTTAWICATLVVFAAILLGSSLASPTASAAGLLSWSAPVLLDHQAPFEGNRVTDVSCPSTTLCVAVDAVGNVLTSSNPNGGTGAWTVTSVHPNNSNNGLTGVSCPSASLCVVSTVGGQVLTSTDPTGGASAWTATKVDETTFGIPDAISCPTTLLCVGADQEGNVVTLPTRPEVLRLGNRLRSTKARSFCQTAFPVRRRRYVSPLISQETC